MIQLVAIELMLVASVIAGSALALLLYRHEKQHGYMRKLPLLDAGMNGTLGVVGGAVAFILGLLLLFSVQQYSSADTTAAEEAVDYLAVFDATAAFPEVDQQELQRSLVCLMRSTAQESWNAGLSGDKNTLAWSRRVQATLSAMPTNTPAEKGAQSEAQSMFAKARQSGHQRLLYAVSDMPSPVWMVIFLSMFVISLLITFVLIPHPLLAIVAVTSNTLLIGGIVAALLAFAGPFDGLGVDVEPTALESVMNRMQDSYPGPIWDPCERLAPSKSG